MLKQKNLNKSVGLCRFMNLKYCFLFLFFLLLPQVYARYYVNYGDSFNVDSYCQIFLAQYIPDETSVLSNNQKMWFYYRPTTNNYNISVRYDAVYVVQNVSENLTNVTEVGWWDKTKLAMVAGLDSPRVDLPWYYRLLMSGASGVVELYNVGYSFYNVFVNVKSGSDSMLYGTNESGRTIYFDLSVTTRYRIVICQNVSRSEYGPLYFVANVGFPDTKYTPCDSKHFVNYLFEWFYPLFAILLDLSNVITEVWFIIYWILKISIIIGIVFGSVWLIMYIYRLVRDTLR